MQWITQVLVSRRHGPLLFWEGTQWARQTPNTDLDITDYQWIYTDTLTTGVNETSLFSCFSHEMRLTSRAEPRIKYQVFSDLWVSLAFVPHEKLEPLFNNSSRPLKYFFCREMRHSTLKSCLQFHGLIFCYIFKQTPN